MGFRWIGAMLIVISCTGCGFSIAAGNRREERLLLQLLRILQFMESELRYRLTALPDLCRMAAGEVNGVMNSVFMNLSWELDHRKLPDAGSCMYAAIAKSGELPGRIRRLLTQLGFTLGRFDLEGQVQGLGIMKQRCEESLARLQKNRDERLRSYQTLGICAGAALAIILI